MSESLLADPAAPAPGALARRHERQVSRQAARSAFWRMLGTVYPHRQAMILGLVLGLGVALTYTASLGGLLPVLKVVVEQQNLNVYLHERALHVQESSPLAAAALRSVADVFPGPDVVGAQRTALFILVGVLLATNIVGNALRAWSQYLVLYASNRAMMDLRRHMFRKTLHVPADRITGDVSNRVSQFMSDAREVFLGVTTLFGKVAREPLKAVCVLVLALLVDWRITALMLAVAPLAVGALWYFGRRIRKSAMRLLEGYGRMLGGLEETLQGIDVVKGYGREGHERRRMWQLERRMLGSQLRLAWIESVSSPLIEVCGILVASAGIVWLALQTIGGTLEPSRFMTMVVLLAAMLDPIRKVANVYNMVQRAGAAATRIFEFLDQPEERSPRRAPAPPRSEPPPVAFEQVTFRYTPTQQPAALDAVSLTVRPGECLALVGPNGSGKSTLLKLLPRLLEPQSGQVRIDGEDVRDLRLRDLRQMIAVVTQRPVIFARSVAENIAYGLPAASLDQIRAAARQAHADEFIANWPAGYETQMGEFGTSVSGGQRQRIAIARAFLKPARVLVFDEATSEIDAESEQKIHDALNTLRRGKTTFLIAHRHTVMDLADRIVVMDGGRIVDVGTLGELLARCPLFVGLYRSPSPH